MTPLSMQTSHHVHVFRERFKCALSFSLSWAATTRVIRDILQTGH